MVAIKAPTISLNESLFDAGISFTDKKNNNAMTNRKTIPRFLAPFHREGGDSSRSPGAVKDIRAFDVRISPASHFSSLQAWPREGKETWTTRS